MTQQLANTSSFQEHMEIEHQDYKLIIEKQIWFYQQSVRAHFIIPMTQMGKKLLWQSRLYVARMYCPKDFSRKGATLSLLMSIEKEWNAQEEQDHIKVAPVYLWDVRVERHTYLLMEFIHGRQIPDLLREYGHLNEHDAARIAWQLYHLLNILRVKYKRPILI